MVVEVTKNGAAATVAINRPDVHNALNPEVMEGLFAAFKALHEAAETRVVILTGVGQTFCAGGDLKMMRAAADYTFEDNLAGGYQIFDLMQLINSFPKPVIGRINGAAIGGGIGMVSCCDIVVAVERAKFGFSEVRLGIVPATISPFVVNKIGVSNARQLFLTGERFEAAYAQQIGLVHHVVAEEELDAKVNERVEQLLQASPHAQAVAKNLIETIAYRPLVEMRDFTARTIAEVRDSDDGREGMSSFLEKRRPRWQG